jgi:hypothetical protein
MSLLVHPAIDPSSSMQPLPANSSCDSIFKVTNKTETVKKNGLAIAPWIIAENSLHDDGSVKQAFLESTTNDHMLIGVNYIMTAFIDEDVYWLSPIKKFGNFTMNVF